jgi:hypothetical protein
MNGTHPGLAVAPVADAQPARNVALWVAAAYTDAHVLAEVLADAVGRWRTARRLVRRRSGASCRKPQDVAYWLSCPDCSVQVPVCRAPAPQDGSDAAVAELAMADLWLHSLVHEHEGR